MQITVDGFRCKWPAMLVGWDYIQMIRDLATALQIEFELVDHLTANPSTYKLLSVLSCHGQPSYNCNKIWIFSPCIGNQGTRSFLCHSSTVLSIMLM